MQGRASGTPPPRPTLLLPPPALSRSNSSSEFSVAESAHGLNPHGVRWLRGKDLGVYWGNGCGVSRACSGAPFIGGGGQTGALARADLTGAHGGANGTERHRRGLGWAELVGDGPLDRGEAMAATGLWRLGGGRSSLAAELRAPVMITAAEKWRGGGALGGGFCRGWPRLEGESWCGFASTPGQPGPGSTAPAGAGCCPRRHTERDEREI